MNDTPSGGDVGRLVACRACGNRVARSARRCPACGEREPAGAQSDPVPAESETERPPRATRGSLLGLVAAALVGAAAAGLVAYVVRPAAVAPPPVATAPAPVTPTPPAVTTAPPRPEPPAPAATSEPPRDTPAPASPAPTASRSRGRPDWLFFFKPGDRLARMSDDAEVGLVLRTEKTHTFPDGTTGPAYLVQVPEGGKRFLDADELERGTRLQ
jgi:hypothetical protein